MIATGPVDRNQFISKSPPCLQIADLKVSAKQQLLRVEDREDPSRLVCMGSSFPDRPTRVRHGHCSSELGYAESTARIWNGCY